MEAAGQSGVSWKAVALPAEHAGWGTLALLAIGYRLGP